MNNQTNSNNAQETVSLPPSRGMKLPRISLKVAIIVAVVVLLLGLAYYFKGLFVAALVNGKPISRVAVISELEKTSGREALNNLINEALIESEAAKNKITVSKEEIDERVQQLRTQFEQQGATLEEALQAEGVNMADLEKQISLQKMAQKMLGDKIKVSDEELNSYIAEHKPEFDAGKEAEQKEQLREQLSQDKFSQEVAGWLNELRANANIREFVQY